MRFSNAFEDIFSRDCLFKQHVTSRWVYNNIRRSNRWPRT